MLKLSRNGIGLLTSQYKSVLRKCMFLNMCAAGMITFASVANAVTYDSATSPEFQYMATTLDMGDSAFVYGRDGYNVIEIMSEGDESISDAHKNGWIRNHGITMFGYNTSGVQVSSTSVEHKHNITVGQGLAINGGGVIANMNNDSSNTQLTIYKTDFSDNSATRFINELGGVDYTGMSVGGVISNYSKNQADLVLATFNDNYTMHFNQASGGAIYNGSNALYGTEIVLGSIQSSGSVFANNHAGNELMEIDFPGISSQVESKILDVWVNNSTDTLNGSLGTLATGGAIHNTGSYTSNSDRFEYNHAVGITSKGGAIYNDKNNEYPTLGEFGGEMNLNGIVTFVNNYAGKGVTAIGGTSYATTAHGGAIYNDGELNIASGVSDAVYFGNDTGTPGSAGNYAIAEGEAAGGAVYNDTNGEINAIRSNTIFQENYAQSLSTGSALGGAIANYGKIALEGGTYTNNRAVSANGSALGGAIYNGVKDSVKGKITLDVDQNTVFSGNSAKSGGAIYNAGIIDGTVSSDAILRFTGNSASETSGDMALGNSIYNASGASISIQLTDNAKIHFDTDQSVYNDGTLFRIAGSNNIPSELGSAVVSTMAGGDDTGILLDTTLYSASDSAVYTINRTNLVLSSTGYIDSKAITSSALNDTALNLNNNTIELQSGSHMNLNSGNDTLSNNDFTVASNAALGYKNQNDNTAYLANTINNSGTVSYYANSNNSDVYVAKALINSNTLNAAADSLLTNIHIDNLKSKENNQIVVNLYNPSGNPSESKADILVIDNTIHSDAGTATKIVFNDMANQAISQVYLGTDDKIYFAKTQTSQPDYDFDNTFTTTARNDNYVIKVGYEENGAVYDWFLYRAADIDPALDPEDIALIDLPRAALEQTRSILFPISRTNRGQCSCYQDNCNNGYCQYENTRTKRRLWATPIYRKGTYDKPIETDFTLKGIDFGFDYQPTHSDMLGIFGSYRNGTYENDGNKGKKYFSHFGSELDITSLIGGLYYRKYFGNLYMLGAVYGGKLDVDVKTDTKVKGTVDGHTIGAQGEMGYDIRLTHREVLTPSLRATYGYVKFKDATVNNKKVSISAVNNVELEAAIKYEYQFNNEYQLPTTGYIKPSVIQTISNGGKVKIADREYTDTIENETLGRIEIGADAEIIKNFSVGAFGNYTFGSEYKAWGVGGNVKYVW